MKLLIAQLYLAFSVIGDGEVTLGQFPFLVLIKLTRNGSTVLTTGTLISLSWVLTSSRDIFLLHHKLLDLGNILVFANITSYTDLSTACVRNINSIEVEPTQRYDDHYPNIVLLHLQEPFPKIDGYIDSVHINYGRLDWTCVLVGWGQNIASNAIAHKARYQYNVPFTAKQCASEFRLIEFPSQMCTQTSTQSNWTALIGSPLICAGALTALKHLDTYFTISYFRISLFIRLRAYTAWIEATVPDILPLVNHEFGIEDKDDYIEPWVDKPNHHSDIHGSSASNLAHKLFFLFFIPASQLLIYSYIIDFVSH